MTKARRAPVRPKLNREEKNEDTRRRLFAAAAKIVGKYGYAEASVARITAAAGVAQGTFYNHFESRQELLDQLLPTIDQDMTAFIRARVDPALPEADKEVARAQGFFDFMVETPEFFRIFYEAEHFAPAGYKQYLDDTTDSYMRVLRRGIPAGEDAYSEEELAVVVRILLAARACLAQGYSAAGGKPRKVPDHVLSAYSKLLKRGLFS
jgi:AcrR family transcriptional regulator